jgi:hypothetical protein
MSTETCSRCGKPATHCKVWAYGSGGLGQYMHLYYCPEHYVFDPENEIDRGCLIRGEIRQ